MQRLADQYVDGCRRLCRHRQQPRHVRGNGRNHGPVCGVPHQQQQEGKLWFALGRLGTLLLAIACWLLWQRYGTLDLRLLDMRMQQLPLGSDIWLLGVIGFGLLAGIIPLHGWVPQAHANASAPAAALFSTVVMKIGLLGILTLSLLGGNAPLWWGSRCWCSV